jgi:tetratricopeptide (TPR) repeat protein
MPTMPEHRPTRPSERVDELCDRFETAWRAGAARRIEDVLAEVEAADRPALLSELLALERELRRKRGERPAAHDYLYRFPEHAEVVRAVFGVAPSAGAGPAARAHGDTGRNLLFGVLALQNNFISRDDLVTAFAVWVADKARPLAQLLVDRGVLDDARRLLLEALVAEHIKQHGGDAEASLAAVSSLGSVRNELGRLDDAELQASIAAAGYRPGGDTGVTATFAPSSHIAGARFRILRFHREGGLGRVYVARDEELGRDVALKEIRPDKVAEADLRGRFVLEAEINGGLEHPGIVPVYSLGTYADGRPVYAMRFVEGDSLKEAIDAYHKEHARPDPNAVEFRKLLGRFIDVCEAIAFAHSKGVLHRDLKPHNVMLGRFGETLLIDWGLAKATGRREPVGPAAACEATLVPPSGSGHAPTLGVLGSPPYMSPEQSAGAVESLGPLTDVYGLGAILFALLTGEPPVEGGAVEEVLDRARRGAIRPPRSLNANIPRALEAVCLKALATRPDDRYPSARALADDLERWLADEPVCAVREPFAEQVRRWAKRNRTAFASASAALLAGLVGISALAAQQFRANVRLGAALAETRKAQAATRTALAQSEESRNQAEAVSAFLVEAFRSPDPSQSGREVKVVDILDPASARLEREFAGSRATKAALLDDLGITYRTLGLADKAVSLHTQARTIRAAFLGPDHADTLSVCNNLAKAYRSAGRFAEAIALLETTVKLREAKLGPDHLDTIKSCNNLASAYRAGGRLTESIALSEATLKPAQAKLGRDHPVTLASRSHLASAFVHAGRHPEAIHLDEATLKLREATLGPDHPDTLSVCNNLGVEYMRVGRLSEAIATLERTLRLEEAKLGPDHPTTLMTCSNLANAYWSAGRFDHAIATHRTNLKRREAKLGPDHPDTLASRTNLAGVSLVAGRWPEAIPLYETTLKLAAHKVGMDHPDTLKLRIGLAMAYDSAGRFSDAMAMYMTTLRLCEAKIGRDHPDTLICRNGLGMAYYNVGKLSEATALYATTLELQEAKVGRDHPETLDTRNNLANAYAAAGRMSEAIALHESTSALYQAKVGADHASTLLSRGNLADAYLSTDRVSDGEQLARDVLARRRKTTKTDSSLLAGDLSRVARILLAQSRSSEAEPLLREALGISRKAAPDNWARYEAMSLLGEALAGEGRYGEADALVTAGYDGMKSRESSIAVPERSRLLEASVRVVRLYDAWGKPALARAWKAKLGLPDLPADVFAKTKLDLP